MNQYPGGIYTNWFLQLPSHKWAKELLNMNRSEISVVTGRWLKRTLPVNLLKLNPYLLSWQLLNTHKRECHQGNLLVSPTILSNWTGNEQQLLTIDGAELNNNFVKTKNDVISFAHCLLPLLCKEYRYRSKLESQAKISLLQLLKLKNRT